jgi:hypothetical protein
MNTLIYNVAVIMLYGLIFAGIVYFAIKKTHLFVILSGVAAIVAAIPVGYIAELSIDGCCGAPSTSPKGVGIILGGLLGVAGIVLLAINSRFKTKQK